MRVLLTGASSFSGLWIAKALAGGGHEVIAAMRSAGYEEPVRVERVRQVAEVAEIAPGAPFGGDAFVDLIARRGPFDAICHHGAEAAGHKRPDFDVAGAVASNTFGAERVLAAAKAAGVRRLVLTGTAFEEGEGIGEEPRRAFSPYGLSKTLTSRAFAQMTAEAGVDFVKFVVPNPFGPFEAQTFQRFVMTAWREGRGVNISHPLYERDNVPVDLMARVYAAAAEGRLGAHVSPSFYAGPVGDFFRRMAREIGPRTGWACQATYAESQSFDEPRTRLNLQPINPDAYGWSEVGFWDAYAAYYASGG
ncbi:MAG TPA: NAD(P)-dependent oxidoreductase [Caulobacteraceae bacterium]|nr:NAD(P)-dependent oxidoreductase [Caulobacteraceae bacterium]